MPSLAIPLIASAIAAAAAFGVAWTAQDWRYGSRIDKMVATYAEARLQAESAARTQEQVLSTKVIEAQNAQVKRTRALQADATAARTELGKLRDATAAALRLSADSPSACNQYANTLSDVFNQCGTAFEDLAAKAGGHASDVKTLSDSWPVKGAAP